MDDAFGDRMKAYEMAEAGRKLMTDRIPVIARLDGKNFSKFTKGLARPYDERLSRLMIYVTRYLVEWSGAACGYTQSDEITLGWYQNDFKSQMMFDGRVQKITSVTAAVASGAFVIGLKDNIPEKADQVVAFDCRAWNVPNLDEGANCFLWREQDATKNSISMAARHYYSHNQLHEKTGPEMQEMLFQKGVNWNGYPNFFKRGSYVQKRTVTRKFTTEELDALPPLHNARKTPDLEFERTEYNVLDIPPLSKIVNRPGLLFFGEAPVLAAETAV